MNNKADEKVNIVFFLGSLQIGGAEKLVLQILRNINRKKFNPILCVFEISGGLQNEFEQLNIPMYDFKYKKSIITIWSFIRFIRFLKKTKIDVIHTSLVGSYIFTTLGARIAGVKNIVLSWSNVYKLAYTEKAKHVWLGSRLAHNIIAISEIVKSGNCKIYNIKPQKVQVVYCSIDINFWKPTKKKAPQNKIIGTTGRLVLQKGYDVLLLAFKEVLNQIDNIELEIIGNGPKENELKEQAIALGISNSVRFLNSISNDQIVEKMDEWSIFVSTSNWEGFGIVLIEAMALGKVIIATNVDAIPEVIEDGISGYLCPPKDYRCVANNIIKLVQDEERADKMGKAGRVRVEKFFTIKRMIDDLEKIYKLTSKDI